MGTRKMKERYTMHWRSAMNIWSTCRRQCQEQYSKKGLWRTRDRLLKERRGQTLWLGKKLSQGHRWGSLSHWTQIKLSTREKHRSLQLSICSWPAQDLLLFHQSLVPSVPPQRHTTALFSCLSGHGHQMWCANSIQTLWSPEQFSSQHALSLQWSYLLQVQKEHAAIDSSHATCHRG